MELLCKYNNHPGAGTWRENWFGTDFVRGGKIVLAILCGEDRYAWESELCCKESNPELNPTVELQFQDMSETVLGLFI